VAYLASPEADAISGQVFVAYGPMVVLASAPGIEQRFDATDPTWSVDGLADALGPYFRDRDGSKSFRADAFTSL
jgi:3-oxoacyl-[acyl-carrier protein] reductase